MGNVSDTGGGFALTDREWAGERLEQIGRKATGMIKKAREVDFIPYTVQNGSWACGPMDGMAWWTNGFYPAFFWQLYALTGEGLYREEAVRAQCLLDKAFEDFPHLHHDVGFMWRISSGFQYDLEGGQEALQKTLYAANLLLGRYNPNGFIRAWNGDCVGWAIIDCMMNLSLLYFASEKTGDPRFALAAQRHAETVRKHFIRENGSSEHIVIFDPMTGDVLDKPGGQGYGPGSEWTRGQGWAAYGFSLAGRHLKREDFTQTALNVARHAVLQLGENDLCPVDFLAPESPLIYDDCASAILACAFLDLHEQTGDPLLKTKASQMLHALSDHHASWGEESPAILQHCTGAYHGKDHEIPMIYGDYYFLEGLIRLAGKIKLRW